MFIKSAKQDIYRMSTAESRNVTIIWNTFPKSLVVLSTLQF